MIGWGSPLGFYIKRPELFRECHRSNEAIDRAGRFDLRQTAQAVLAHHKAGV